MTATILNTLAEARHEEALANARAVIRARPGVYADLAVLDACARLEKDGDWLDFVTAGEVRAAVLSQVDDDPSAVAQIVAALSARPWFALLGDAVGLAVLFGLLGLALAVLT